MSDMMAPGEAEPRVVTCKGCAQPVTQRQYRGIHLGAEWWRTDSHSAPCGLPCFGASVGGKEYKSGRIHRNNEKCPICIEQPREIADV